MKPGQLLACSVSLVVAGLLLTRGFIGINPGRPLFVFLGVVLAASATVGLAVDHVSIRATAQSPADLLAAELGRSRRYGHPLCLVAVVCDEGTSDEIIRRLRGTDRAWRQRNGLRLLLPETDRQDVLGFAARMEPVLRGCEVRAAVFPVDGLTAEGLEDALAPVRPFAVASAAEPATVPFPASESESEPASLDGPDAAVGEA
jgi:hypothetical protein